MEILIGLLVLSAVVWLCFSGQRVEKPRHFTPTPTLAEQEVKRMSELEVMLGSEALNILLDYSASVQDEVGKGITMGTIDPVVGEGLAWVCVNHGRHLFVEECLELLADKKSVVQAAPVVATNTLKAVDRGYPGGLVAFRAQAFCG